MDDGFGKNKKIATSSIKGFIQGGWMGALAGFVAIPAGIIAAGTIGIGFVLSKVLGKSTGFFSAIVGGSVGVLIFLILCASVPRFIFPAMFYLAMTFAILGGLAKGALSGKEEAATRKSDSTRVLPHDIEQEPLEQKSQTPKKSIPEDRKINKSQREEPLPQQKITPMLVEKKEPLFLENESIVFPFSETKFPGLIGKQVQPLKIEQIEHFKKEFRKEYQDWEIKEEPVVAPVSSTKDDRAEKKPLQSQIIEVINLARPEEKFQLEPKTGQFKTHSSALETFEVILQSFKLIHLNKLPKISAPQLKLAELWEKALKKIFSYPEKEIKKLIASRSVESNVEKKPSFDLPKKKH